MAVRGVTFDFWGTLFADDGDAPDKRQRLRVRAFADMTGAKIDACNEAHEAIAKAFHEHHVTKKQTLTPADAVRMMAEHCEVTLGDKLRIEMTEIFAQAILDYPPKPLPGALDAVALAADRGPVGIVSDAGLSPGESLRALLDRNGFTERLTAPAVVFSSDLGVAKPDPAMFRKAAAGLGVAVEEMLHIGDLEPTDIAGALGVGAAAVLYTGHNAKYAAGTRARHVLPEWSGLGAVLAAL